MCLDAVYTKKTDEYDYRKKPYNASKFRWKMLFIDADEDGIPTQLISPFQDDIWKVGKNYKAENANGDPDHGFHVLMSKAAAARLARDEYAARLARDEYGYDGCAVVKVQVSGFIAGGLYGDEPCETWKNAKIVEVWTGAGRANITKRFK